VSTPARCPEKAEYQRLLLGQLSTQKVDSLSEHVEDCSRCTELVAGLKAEDSLHRVVRAAPAAAAELPRTPLVEGLIRRICRLGPPGAPEAGELTHGGGPQTTPPPVEDESFSWLGPAQAPEELGWLGPYRILEKLGAGGMGIVFRAEDPALQRAVALKTMKPSLAANESARIRFRREAQAAAAIQHDHIVTIHYVGEDRSVPFLAMQLLQGEPLEERLRREGALPPAEVLRIGREVAEGLAAAHEQELIHRDVKPANIWLEKERGRVKILDFGLVFSSSAEDRLTDPGGIAGTPQYMSPEQASGKTVDARSDLFSLGCVLYRLATGTLPFQGPDAPAVLRAITMDQPKAPRKLNPALPLGLSVLIMKLLAKRPDDRLESARAVVQAIEAIERPRAPVPRRRKATPYLLAGVAAALFVAVGLGAYQLSSAVFPHIQPSPDQGPYAIIPRTQPAFPVPPPTPKEQQSAPLEATPLASKAQKVLQKNCYRCHGENGAIEGGFNYVLDAKRLRVRKKVIAGQPDDSPLYKRLIDPTTPMPPEEEGVRPTKGEIVDVRRWIEAGAPDLQPIEAVRKSIPESEILEEIVYNDLKNVDKSLRPLRRYFTITHLFNAGLGAEELQTYRLGLAKLVNSLSWGRRVILPEAIDTDKTVYRIDLRDYGWEKKEWEKVVEEYPYGVEYDSPAARFCYTQTECSVPCVRADWFVFAASRPPLYHALLKLPETDRELEKKLQVDAKANLRDGKAVRAGFGRSGIALHNRIIERHDLAHGAYYWKTYDFARSDGRQNIFQHPQGPGPDDGSFQPSGTEIIFSLPNDLQAYMLVDAKGNRLDEGPIDLVVADLRKGLGPKVINGISCMSCHAHGIIAKEDEIRAQVERDRGAAKIAPVLNLYPPQDKLKEFYHDDAARFTAAVKKTGAAPGATEPIVALALRYYWELDLNLAAAEAGVNPEVLKAALLKGSPRLASLAPLKSEGGTIPRQVFDDAFDELVHVLHPGASRPKNYGPEVVNSIGMRFRLIPKGEFQMGSPPGEKGRGADENQHTVEITQPFYLGEFEVTQEEYEQVMKGNPSHFKDRTTKRFPVESVSWEQAQKFCEKLSADPAEQRLRRSYRLPTEAEWEWAARAGTSTAYSFGDDAETLGDYGWFTENGGEMTHEVGKKKANLWGLFDMYGNVAEWCSDWYDSDYYRKRQPSDPKGPATGQLRVLRGGNFDASAARCRSADRGHSLVQFANKAYGFRVVLVEARKAP
jgi:formylglycine-generating enzyme required for sulfatase activity/serine/threonine protein kinase